MKKLISIGIALALLTIAVVPGVVAAQDEPSTYSKIPFAIIGTGIKLVGDVVDAVPTIADMIPFDLPPVTNLVGDWTSTNLAWSVDMVAWGMHLVGVVWGIADSAFDIGYPEIEDLLEEVACGLRTCFSGDCAGDWVCPP